MVAKDRPFDNSCEGLTWSLIVTSRRHLQVGKAIMDITGGKPFPTEVVNLVGSSVPIWASHYHHHEDLPSYTSTTIEQHCSASSLRCFRE